MGKDKRCGTCRYYEPSPLRNKGWCRNPAIFDLTTNHLVSNSDENCSRVFGAHWAPSLDTALSSRPGWPSARRTTVPSPASSGQVTGEAPLRSTLPSDGPDSRQDGQAAAPQSKTPSHQRASRGRHLPELDRRLVLVSIVVVVALALAGGFRAWQSTRTIMGDPTPPASSILHVESTPTRPAIPSLPTPTTVGAQPSTSPGQPPTQGLLQKGGKARVAGTGAALQVRDGIGTAYQVVGKLSDGEVVTLLAGPEQADGHVWWQVQVDGTIGWVADDWLEPVQ